MVLLLAVRQCHANINHYLARMRKIGNVGDGVLDVPRNALHAQRDAEGGVPYTYKFRFILVTINAMPLSALKCSGAKLLYGYF